PPVTGLRSVVAELLDHGRAQLTDDQFLPGEGGFVQVGVVVLGDVVLRRDRGRRFRSGGPGCGGRGRVAGRGGGRGGGGLHGPAPGPGGTGRTAGRRTRGASPAVARAGTGTRAGATGPAAAAPAGRARRGGGGPATSGGVDDGLDLPLDPELLAQRLAQHVLAAAAEEVVAGARVDEADLQGGAVEAGHLGVLAEQDPGEPAAVLHRFQDVRPEHARVEPAAARRHRSRVRRRAGGGGGSGGGR